MDLQKILIGTTLAAVGGGAYGAVLGLLRDKPLGIYAFNTSVNTGLMGLSFFVLRDSMVRQQLAKKKEDQDEPSDGEALFCSTIAGGISGAFWTTFAKGNVGSIPSGFILFGGLCAMGQILANTIDGYRRSSLSAPPSKIPNEGYLDRLDRWYQRWEKRLTWLPVKRISDEEYKKQLQRRLEQARLEYQNIDQEIERLRRSLVDASKDDK